MKKFLFFLVARHILGLLVFYFLFYFFKSNFRTIFLIYFENNVCCLMFYGLLGVNVGRLTTVFGCEIICLCGCLPNACDVFPLLLTCLLSLQLVTL